MSYKAMLKDGTVETVEAESIFHALEKVGGSLSSGFILAKKVKFLRQENIDRTKKAVRK